MVWGISCLGTLLLNYTLRLFWGVNEVFLTSGSRDMNFGRILGFWTHFDGFWGGSYNFFQVYTFLFQREYCYGLKSVVKPSSRKSGHGYAIFSLTNIQWHAKVLNTLQIVEFFKYYMIDDCQTWSEYSNITGFFTDNRLMNKKYYFFINSEIFKITLRKSFGHIQFFIDFFVISLWYCIQVALVMFHDGLQLLSQAKLITSLCKQRV